MKSTLATLALFIAGHALGQTPPITEPAPPPAISDEDTARILAEITKVQKEFAQTKKDLLASALTRYKAAAASDAEAQSFYLACYKVVNLDRKPATTKEEAEERTNGDWQKRAVASLGEGGSATLFRLQLQLLAMLLEPRTEGDEAARVTTLRTYVQNVASLLPKLNGAAEDEKPERKPVATVGKKSKREDDDVEERRKGPRKNGAWAALQRGVMGTLFTQAYHLETYFDAPPDSLKSPADFRTAYASVILPWYRTHEKAKLPEVWDEYLRALTTVAQMNSQPAELAAWGANEYKSLLWDKSLDLLNQGVDATPSAANLIKLVRENPQHPQLKKWIADLAQAAEAMGGLKFGDPKE